MKKRQQFKIPTEQPIPAPQPPQESLSGRSRAAVLADKASKALGELDTKTLKPGESLKLIELASKKDDPSMGERIGVDGCTPDELRVLVSMADYNLSLEDAMALERFREDLKSGNSPKQQLARGTNVRYVMISFAADALGCSLSEATKRLEEAFKPELVNPYHS